MQGASKGPKRRSRFLSVLTRDESRDRHSPTRYPAERNPDPSDTFLHAVYPQVPSKTSTAPSASLNSVWAQAFIEFQKDEDSKKLLRSFVRLILDDRHQPSRPEAATIADSYALTPDEWRQILHTRSATAEEELSKGGKVHDLASGTLDRITQAKDALAFAASFEPHATIVWSGVSVLLPILSAVISAKSQALQGLKYVSDLLTLYRLKEDTYPTDLVSLSREGAKLERVEVLRQWRRHVIEVYKKAIEFQVRVAVVYRRDRFARYIRNLTVRDDWESIVTEMRNLAEKASQHGGAIDSHRLLQLVETATEEKNQEILEALSLRDYDALKDAHDRAAPGTCDWFFNTSRYQEWLSGEKPLMFLVAGAGCGKSVLARHVLDTLDSTEICCHYFFRDTGSGSDTCAVALASLLHQLCRKGSARALSLIQVQWRSLRSKLLDNIGVLWKILLQCAEATDAKLVCILDALDEAGSLERDRFMQLVNNHYRQAGTGNLRLIVSGRPYYDHVFKFQILANGIPFAVFDIEQFDLKDEIESILRAKIGELDLSPSVQEHLLSQMLRTQTKSRTFLWLKIVMDQLRYDITYSWADRSSIDGLLNHLPSSVDDAYEALLSRSPDPAAARLLLSLILGYSSGLPLDVLQIAFGIAKQESRSLKTSFDDLQDPNGFGIRVRTLCGMFVTIVGGAAYLFHQTARDFLQGVDEETNVGSSKWKQSITGYATESTWTAICGAYLRYWHASGHEAVAVTDRRWQFHQQVLQQWLGHYNSMSFSLSPSSPIPDVPGAFPPSEEALSKMMELKLRGCEFQHILDMGDSCFWASPLMHGIPMFPKYFWTDLESWGFAFADQPPMNAFPLQPSCWHCKKELCSCQNRLTVTCSDIEAFKAFCTRNYSLSTQNPELYAIYVRAGLSHTAEGLLESWKERDFHRVSNVKRYLNGLDLEEKLRLLAGLSDDTFILNEIDRAAYSQMQQAIVNVLNTMHENAMNPIRNIKA